MKKIEQVFREILYQTMEKQGYRFTQLGLSKTLSISLSVVNLAVKKLERIGALKVQKMSFNAIDIKKILYYWASIRRLDKDIIYQTRAEMPVTEIEKNLPEVVYAGYSAYKFKFKDVPADYSEVYAYAGDDELPEIIKRFPENKKKPNLFILNKDDNLDKYSKTGTIAQIFVDLWNMKEWYAKEFLTQIGNKAKELK
ncbi:MAG: hypothetical protein KKA64_02865 [Nanoarchaeota archaeon]|nr:hypothetical protein [Nanoarchaeota archaeon]